MPLLQANSGSEDSDTDDIAEKRTPTFSAADGCPPPAPVPHRVSWTRFTGRQGSGAAGRPGGRQLGRLWRLARGRYRRSQLRGVRDPPGPLCKAIGYQGPKDNGFFWVPIPEK